MDAAAYCADLVRQRDPDRYFADLFAPAHARPHMLAIHAFNAEIVRIGGIASEPMPGEIRLQWWRDALESGDAGGNPVASALLETIGAFQLPIIAFQSLLEARTFDLYNDPMPDRAAFEGYAGDTASSLFQLAAIVLAGGHDPGSADAAGYAGVAHALTVLLRAFPLHAARKQLFLPAEAFAAHLVETDAVFAREDTQGIAAALADLRAAARTHLRQSREAVRSLPAAVAPAFLPLALVEPYLRGMERPDYRPFSPAPELPQWKRQWILWRASRRGI
jgi:phytoene synthase